MEYKCPLCGADFSKTVDFFPNIIDFHKNIHLRNLLNDVLNTAELVVKCDGTKEIIDRLGEATSAFRIAQKKLEDWE